MLSMKHVYMDRFEGKKNQHCSELGNSLETYFRAMLVHDGFAKQQVEESFTG